MNRRKSLILSLCLCMAATFAVAAPAQAVNMSSLPYTRPSIWAPTDIQAQMGYEGWGNVAYWVGWDLALSPGSLWAWENELTSMAYSLEIGYKPTGGDNCRQLLGGLNGKAGYPDAAYVGPDYTEDPTDAVLFIGDMDVVAPDQRANPTRDYAAWWSCASAFNPSVGPAYNVQQGTAERPFLSDSRAQMNYVPAEKGSAGFPALNPWDGFHQSTAMRAPWTRDWSFEQGSTGWSSDFVSSGRACGGAGDGSCYLIVGSSTSPETWVRHQGWTLNQVAPEGGSWAFLNIGGNTGFQYEGWFRCFHSTTCVVDIWLRGQTGQAWDPARHKRSVSIPNDGGWYFYVQDNWPAGGETTVFDLYINTRGQRLDVDAQWVSGGI